MTRTPRRWLALALLAFAAACGMDSAVPRATAERPEPSGGRNAPEHLDKPYVVLISFDGMRWDFPARVETPNIDRVVRQGARAESLIPVFPTQTFTNHYTVATGMYAETHGLVENIFYDAEFDATYSLRDRATVEDGRWYGGEPIWVTAESQGMVSASYFWVGTEAPVKGIQPTHWYRFDETVPPEERVDQVLAWLRLPAEERPHLITLYFHEVDTSAHDHGPYAPEVDEAVRLVDSMLGRLLDGLDALPIADRVHIVIVSDHGMIEVDGTNWQFLDDHADLDGVRVLPRGQFAMLHFDGDDGKRDEVHAALSAGLEHAAVYRRHEIPERYRVRGSPRIGDILVVMEPPHQIGIGGRVNPARGMHGYDPIDRRMHGIFFATGPRLRENIVISSFEPVHIYPLLAEILELRPYPGIDGSLEVLQPLLR